MIGVEGSYIITFFLAEFNDFLTEDDLTSFKVVEEAGNLLPSFELVFNTTNEDIIGSLSEGSNLRISYGKDQDNLYDSIFHITEFNLSSSGTNRKQVSMAGILSVPKYTSTTRLFISEKLSGIEVLINKASPYFEIDSNVDKSNDEMNWVQANTSDKRFIDELWMHSNLEDSWPALGIRPSQESEKATLVIRDMKKLMKPGGFDWKFTQDTGLIEQEVDRKENLIPYDGDYTIRGASGFMNHWLGYNQRHVGYNIEVGDSEGINSESKPLMAQISKFSRRLDVEERLGKFNFLNSNVHDKYNQAALNNLTSLALFSSFRVGLNFRNTFKAFKILDVALFEEISIEDKQRSSRYTSGIYVISKIARLFSDKTHSTYIELTREAQSDYDQDNLQ